MSNNKEWFCWFNSRRKCYTNDSPGCPRVVLSVTHDYGLFPGIWGMDLNYSWWTKFPSISGLFWAFCINLLTSVLKNYPRESFQITFIYPTRRINLLSKYQIHPKVCRECTDQIKPPDIQSAIDVFLFPPKERISLANWAEKLLPVVCGCCCRAYRWGRV